MNFWWRSVEKIRQKMLDSAKESGMHSEETIQYSQELDKVLNFIQPHIKNTLLEIDTERRNDHLILYLKGDLDYLNIGNIEEYIEQIKSYDFKKITIDCDHLSFIDSSGILAILKVIYYCDQEELQFELRGVNEEIRYVFERVGVFEIQKILQENQKRKKGKPQRRMTSNK